jgi:hypothetical protein
MLNIGHIVPKSESLLVRPDIIHITCLFSKPTYLLENIRHECLYLSVLNRIRPFQIKGEKNPCNHSLFLFFLIFHTQQYPCVYNFGRLGSNWSLWGPRICTPPKIPKSVFLPPRPRRLHLLSSDLILNVVSQTCWVAINENTLHTRRRGRSSWGVGGGGVEKAALLSAINYESPTYRIAYLQCTCIAFQTWLSGGAFQSLAIYCQDSEAPETCVSSWKWSSETAKYRPKSLWVWRAAGDWRNDHGRIWLSLSILF